MAKVFVTRKIPDIGISMLRERGHEVIISNKDRPLTKEELITELKSGQYDAVLSQLTDGIDKDVFDGAPSVKVFANYAIGFNNFDIEEGKKRGVFLSNTPGGGAERVAEFAVALMLALACRITEGDRFVRQGQYVGFDPMLFHGTELVGKTLGIIGTGRIGAEVARRVIKGFLMKVVYFDVTRNEALEKEFGAEFKSTVEEVLPVADFVSVHVPLMPATHHLINASRLRLMKSTAFLINTSRGPVLDEVALVEALKAGVIRGAGLDVYENEPNLSSGLKDLSNVILTPHIASSTTESREDMSRLAAENILSVLSGSRPANNVY